MQQILINFSFPNRQSSIKFILIKYSKKQMVFDVLVLIMQMKINLPFLCFILLAKLATSNLIYIYSHPCSENFPLTVSIEDIYGTANLNSLKLQLFMSKDIDFCDKASLEKQFKTERDDILPAMVYNSNKCYKQLMQSQLPAVKVVIMTKVDWKSYNEQNAGILSKLSDLLVVQVSSSDVFNIQKYSEKCDNLHGQLYYDKTESHNILDNIHFPNIYFNIQYKNGFNFIREFYLNHLFQAFQPKIKFKHLLLYTDEDCKHCDPIKDCYDVELTGLKRICYEPNPESYRSGRQIIKEQVRSLILASRTETRHLWWKYVVLFADNTCDQAVDLDSCVYHTFEQLGIQKEFIGKIEWFTNQFLKWKELDRLQEAGQLMKFVKTERFKHNVYTTRVYEQLIRHCKQVAPQVFPSPECLQLQHKPLYLTLSKDKNPLIHEFISPNLYNDSIVQQQVYLMVDSKLVASQLLIILKNVDKSYTQFLIQKESLRYVGNILNKQRLLEFQLTYDQNTTTTRSQYQTSNNYQYASSTEIKKMTMTSSNLQKDFNLQMMQLSFPEGNKFSNLKFKLKFNGHEKYILEFHYKNATLLMRAGDKLVHRVVTNTSLYDLVLDDIENNYLNFFYFQCKYKYDPNILANLTLFSNSTSNIMTSQSISYEPSGTQILTIPKKTLLGLKNNKTIRCTTIDLNKTCNVSLRLNFKNRSGSYYNNIIRIVEVRFLKHQNSQIMPYIDQIRTLQLQSTLVQYIDLSNFGENDRILPSAVFLSKNNSDINQEFRICSNFSECDFYKKQNWKDMLDSQTKPISVTTNKGYYQQYQFGFGFKHPASRLRRDEKNKIIRVFIIYHIKQPEYVDFVTLQRKITDNSIYYAETLENQKSPFAQPTGLVNYDAKSFNSSNRFLIKHQNNSKNIVYYAYLAVNNYDGNLRVYAKANLNNLSKQIHFQAYNRQHYQGLKRIFDPNFFELKVKIFSSESQKIYIDFYVEDRAKLINRTDPNIYSIGFTSYKSIDTFRVVHIFKNYKVNVFSELFTNSSKPHFYIPYSQFGSFNSSVVITAFPVETADLAKIFLCYAIKQKTQLGQKTCLKEGKLWDYIQTSQSKRQIGYGYKIDWFSRNNSGLYFNIYHEKGLPLEVKIGYDVYHKSQLIQNNGRMQELKKQKYYSSEVQKRVAQMDNKKNGKSFTNIFYEETKTKKENNSKSQKQKYINQTELNQIKDIEKSLQARKEKAKQEEKSLQIQQQKILSKGKDVRQELKDLQFGQRYVAQQSAELKKKKNEILISQKQNQASYLKYLQQKNDIEKLKKSMEEQKEKVKLETAMIEAQKKQNKQKKDKLNKQVEQNEKLRAKIIEKLNQEKAQLQKSLKENQQKKKQLAISQVQVQELSLKIEKKKQANNEKSQGLQQMQKYNKAKEIKLAQQSNQLTKSEKSNQEKKLKLTQEATQFTKAQKQNQEKKLKLTQETTQLTKMQKQNQEKKLKLTQETTQITKTQKQNQQKQQRLKKQRQQLEKAEKQNQMLIEKNRKQAAEAQQKSKKEPAKKQISQQSSSGKAQKQEKEEENTVKIKFQIEVQKKTGQTSTQKQSQSTKTQQTNQQQNANQKSGEATKESNITQQIKQIPNKQPLSANNSGQLKQNQAQQNNQTIKFLSIMFILLLVLLLFLSFMVFFLYKMMTNLRIKALQPRDRQETCSRIKEVIKEQKAV